MSEARRKAGDLARESLALNDPTGWFEKLYVQAGGDTGAISWAAARFVAPGGDLLVIARGREATDPPGTMPWPLLREELAEFTRAGLEERGFDDFLDAETPPVRRFRVHYRRP